MISHDAAHLALRNRALAYLPSSRAFQNLDYTPTPGVAYCEEDYAPATNALLTVSASNGVAEDRGLYVIRWYGLANTATHAMAASIDALLARFTPGTTMTAGSNTVRVLGRAGEAGPSRSLILPTGGGFAVCTITIPWIAYSTNVIAA